MPFSSLSRTKRLSLSSVMKAPLPACQVHILTHAVSLNTVKWKNTTLLVIFFQPNHSLGTTSVTCHIFDRSGHRINVGGLKGDQSRVYDSQTHQKRFRQEEEEGESEGEDVCVLSDHNRRLKLCLQSPNCSLCEYWVQKDSAGKHIHIESIVSNKPQKSISQSTSPVH